MPTTQGHNDHKHIEQDKREMLSALIREQVLYTLGSPTGLLKVQVRPVGGNNYRVNVLVGPNAASAKVANSYFVQADADGKITGSTPRITKQH